MLLHSCSRNAGGWLPPPTSGQGQPPACVYLISSRVCTYLLHHVKLPFTPQEQSVAPPFLRPAVSDEEVKALFKRPGSVIKALSSTFCMCVHVCTKSQSNRYTCDDIPCIVYIHREGTRLPEGRLLTQTENRQAARIPPEGGQVRAAVAEEGPRSRPHV